MSYRAVLGTRAQADLRAMPTAVARFTLAQIHNLAASPTALSRRAALPFFEQSQVCNFDYAWEGQLYVVNVMFTYADDEDRLLIGDVLWEVKPDLWA